MYEVFEYRTRARDTLVKNIDPDDSKKSEHTLPTLAFGHNYDYSEQEHSGVIAFKSQQKM